MTDHDLFDMIQEMKSKAGLPLTSAVEIVLRGKNTAATADIALAKLVKISDRYSGNASCEVMLCMDAQEPIYPRPKI